MNLLQIVGLRPRARGRMTEAAACALAAARADRAVERPGSLVWDVLGRAVWRLAKACSPDGAPAAFIDMHADDGAVVRMSAPRR